MWIKSSWVHHVALASAVTVELLITTRPLDYGIKIGLTAAIRVLFITVINFPLFRAIKNGKFSQQLEHQELLLSIGSSERISSPCGLSISHGLLMDTRVGGFACIKLALVYLTTDQRVSRPSKVTIGLQLFISDA